MPRARQPLPRVDLLADLPPLISVARAAAILRISLATAHRRANLGTLPGAVKVSERRWMVRSLVLRKWLAGEPLSEPPAEAAPALRVVRAVGDRLG